MLGFWQLLTLLPPTYLVYLTSKLCFIVCSFVRSTYEPLDRFASNLY